MVSVRPALTAEPRSVLGKKVAKLRRQGVLPGIVYGPVVQSPIPVSVPEREFSFLYREVGSTTLIDLTVDGNRFPVFVREVQTDPVRRTALHIDFYAPNLREPVTTTVPVIVAGEVPGDALGVPTQMLQEIEVRALPDQLPTHIEIDVSGLREVGDAVRVGDLHVEPDVEIITPSDEIVYRLDMPEQAEPEPEPTEALAEELGDQPAAINEGVEPVTEE